MNIKSVKLMLLRKIWKYGSPIIFLGREGSCPLSFRVIFKYRCKRVFDFRKEIANFRSHKSSKI